VIAALELGTVRTAKASTPPCRDCGVEAGTTVVTITVQDRGGWASVCSRCFIKGGYCAERAGR
jgi:hypothetical protein